MDSDIQKLIETFLARLSVLVAMFAVVCAFRSGTLSKIKFGSIEISGAI